MKVKVIYWVENPETGERTFESEDFTEVETELILLYEKMYGSLKHIDSCRLAADPYIDA